MIKVLYKPTGNIFILPDEEAMRIKNTDRDESYRFLEYGLQEQKEEEIVTQEEVKEIEAKLEEEKLEEEKPVEKPVKEKAYSRPRKTYDASDLRKLPKKELIVIANKLGFLDMDNCTVDEIIDYIEGNKKKVLKKPGRKKANK